MNFESEQFETFLGTQLELLFNLLEFSAEDNQGTALSPEENSIVQLSMALKRRGAITEEIFTQHQGIILGIASRLAENPFLRINLDSLSRAPEVLDRIPPESINDQYLKEYNIKPGEYFYPVYTEEGVLEEIDFFLVRRGTGEKLTLYRKTAEGRDIYLQTNIYLAQSLTENQTMLRMAIPPEKLIGDLNPLMRETLKLIITADGLMLQVFLDEAEFRRRVMSSQIGSHLHTRQLDDGLIAITHGRDKGSLFTIQTNDEGGLNVTPVGVADLPGCIKVLILRALDDTC
ncbi:hypothetical protein KC622_02745 [Candidatus Dojkabacteria bacterium]|uniref:Uncharacterized protein n=1 Tax=Candidatus Dojkabacteria bacterium TaxID=2099670 RepID=A0A955I637_9BACT|nr:hypothetical protein [Candidatus Dojkabacteria bacterium]